MSRRLTAVVLALAVVLGGAASSAAAAPGTEIVPGSPESVLSSAVYQGQLYFSGHDAVAGRQALFRFDGTSIAVVPGSPAWPHELAVVDGLLYMSAGGPGLDGALWSFDGTSFTEIAGTGALGITSILGHAGDVYFQATSSGLFYVYDPGSGLVNPVLGLPEAYMPTVFDGRLFVDDWNTSTLWQVDAGGVASPVPAPGMGTVTQILGVYDGSLYLVNDEVLTAYDGTVFTPVADSPIDPRDRGTVYDGAFYFAAQDPVTPTRQVLHVYDGTTVTALPGSPDNPQQLTVAGGILYLLETGAVSPRLWSYDGAGFTPIPSSIGNNYLVDYGGTLYFSGTEQDNAPNYLMRVADLSAPVDPADPTLPATGAVPGILGGAAAVILLAAGIALLSRRHAAPMTGGTRPR